MKRLIKIIVPLGILAVGILAASWMIRNPPGARRVEFQQEKTLVEVETVHPSTEQIIVKAQGIVVPAKRVSIRPEVAGKIIEQSSVLIPGGRFSQGQVMIKIDPRNYEFNLEQQKERLEDANYRLKLEEGQREVALQEWEMLGDTVPTTEAGKNLAQRKPHMRRAQISVEAAKSALEKAKLDLERTTIRAPFNSIVIKENVDIGQVVNAQTEIAALVGTDQYWIQVSVPVDHLNWITIPGVSSSEGSEAKVVLRSGANSIERKGRVVRLLGDLDEIGRLARLLIAVNDPLLLKKGTNEHSLPLLLGAFVHVEIYGSELESVYVIPRTALRESEGRVAGASSQQGRVWIVDKEQKLSIREVDIIWRQEETVLVASGLQEGNRLILSNIATPIIGMDLQVEQIAPLLERESLNDN